MKLNGKPVDLHLLRAEIIAAGISIGDLGTAGDDLVTYDADGHTVPDLPAGVAAVLAAHVVPPPLVFTEDVRISGRVQTTSATPTEVYRLPLLPLTGYTGIVTVIGVDTGNGAVRVIRASFAVKRLNGGALAVGSPVVLASHADTGATTWQINASVSGNDALVTVTGAASRTVDWSISGDMTSFTPAGRTP